MKRLPVSLTLRGMSSALVLGLLASTPTLAANAQQERMASCNAQASAKAVQGDQRRAFMSQCLKGAAPTQQEKMSLCNASAGAQALKGDERKRFMSECLKRK